MLIGPRGTPVRARLRQMHVEVRQSVWSFTAPFRPRNVLDFEYLLFYQRKTSSFQAVRSANTPKSKR